jgi:hypothetical protein
MVTRRFACHCEERSDAAIQAQAPLSERIYLSIILAVT